MMMAFALHKKRIYISLCTYRITIAEFIFKRRIKRSQRDMLGYAFTRKSLANCQIQLGKFGVKMASA